MKLLVDIGVFKISGVLIIAVAIFNFAGVSQVLGGLSFVWVTISILGIIGIVIKHTTNFTNGKKNNTTSSSTGKALKALPIIADAHDSLEYFCSLMQMVDNAMPYCNYQGSGYLFGGISSDGREYYRYWYDKDWSSVDTVLNQMLFSIPIPQNISAIAEGWYVSGSSNDTINYVCNNAKGTRAWCGYDSLRSFGISAIENSWRNTITATVNNNWPNAKITDLIIHIDEEKNTISYQATIAT